MEAPKNIDPEEWARFNALNAAQPIRRIPGVTHRSQHEADMPITDIAIEVVELPPAVTDLTLAVRRAADELHGTSAKADRIALQLLTALGRFARETGT